MRRTLLATALVLFGAIAFLGLAAATAEAGGGGHGGCSRPTEGENEPVVIQYNCYAPAVLYVEVGGSVEWQQKDSVPHNVTWLRNGLVDDSTGLSMGDTVSRRFDEPGVYAYYCSIHPSMLGVVVAVGEGVDGSPASSVLTGAGQKAGPAGTLDSGKGNPDAGAGWGEWLVGLGLVGGLLVGLVAVGGGVKLHRRMR